ncbi:hypothetical protein BDV32DRAFT_153165 [Aspergillus pseudonomiae]|uniref:Uncharacterized protein n=1 Tax=Aspergillus pseudonomiae TaxID=1506151 RepID=A0A5N7D1A7_9EURO|nr:uncharacterized protein BDV37DRAFT_286832 [Aspergillus pseudonomiae]KAB8256543.1 hypothetical protein BDV32DRAFT_153165 [Aspergillus pseudonomiae]KAE8400200.1 hypothetical protein BDV37DRAFT_286832 [Aspergillus pseudonomiae]
MDPKPSQHVSEVESPDSTDRLLPEEQSLQQNKFQRHLNTWNALLTDTWFPETVAMIFSVACFVAIIALVKAFEGKPAPVFSRVVTLNAVVSVLGTASKCSLLYVVSQSISQWKWVLLKTERRQLRCIQTIDDASRGPWGSITLLTHERCSVLWIGAAIMVFTLALDFSVQQIIRHSTENVQSPTGYAVAKQALSIDPAWYDKRFRNAAHAGLWYNYDPIPSCSSGNCTWDRFTSIGFCSKCEDMTSVAKIENCTYNIQDRDPVQMVPCNVSLPSGIWSAEPIYTRPGGAMYLPKDIIWQVAWFTTGIDDPVESKAMVFAHAELDVDKRINDTIPLPEGRLKIKRVMKCAISFCARDYKITVSHGAPAITLTNPDWGRMYPFFDEQKTSRSQQGCWTPNRALGKTSIRDQEANLPKPTRGSKDSVCHNFLDLVEKFGNLMRVFSGVTHWEWYQPVGSNWTLKDIGNPDSAIRYVTSRILEVGVGEAAKNVAASLTNDILDNSTDTVNGTAFVTEDHIYFNWVWSIFPTLVLTAGVVFYIATVWASQLEGVCVWKASILPVLYNGTERSVSNGHHDLTTVSKMSSVSQLTDVQLQPSDSTGSMVLR